MKFKILCPVPCRDLLGWFFFFTALGMLALAVASVGNSVRIRETWAEAQSLRVEVEQLKAASAATQSMRQQAQWWRSGWARKYRNVSAVQGPIHARLVTADKRWTIAHHSLHNVEVEAPNL